jgi:hypothetical protein
LTVGSDTQPYGWDEDRNLKGPAASEEATPTFLLFETLKHREQYPERELF